MEPYDNLGGCYTSLFCLIGAIDDGLSLRRKSNKGLSARAKFIMQIGMSLIMVAVLSMDCSHSLV